MEDARLMEHVAHVEEMTIYVQKVLWKKKTWRDHPGKLCIDGRILLKWILREILCKEMVWINLVQNTAQWRDFVNMAMISQVQE